MKESKEKGPDLFDTRVSAAHSKSARAWDKAMSASASTLETVPSQPEAPSVGLWSRTRQTTTSWRPFAVGGCTCPGKLRIDVAHPLEAGRVTLARNVLGRASSAARPLFVTLDPAGTTGPATGINLPHRHDLSMLLWQQLVAKSQAVERGSVVQGLISGTRGKGRPCLEADCRIAAGSAARTRIAEREA